MRVIINLHLKDRCIETEARDEYNRLMDTYFMTDDIEGKLDEKIELLRDFLEESDFRKLRSSDSRLSGGKESDVIIKRNEREGGIILEVY
jgi:hypothetical protein